MTAVSADPFVWVPPGARGSYADEVADMAEMCGRPLDLMQYKAVDALTSYGPGGRWLTLEKVIKGPRQSVGKTGGIITPIVFTDLFTFDADNISWTAHLFKTTRKAFVDHKSLIDNCDALRKRVKSIRDSHGEESIELKNGALLEYLARNKGGGRGMSGRTIVIDEALFYSSEAAAALLPTLATRSVSGLAQVLYASSACKEESDQLRQLTRRGRAGNDPSLIMVEHRARGGWDDPGCYYGKECMHHIGAHGCQLDNQELWMEANPSVGTRVTLKFLGDMRRTFSADPREFGREFLGWDEAGKGDVAHPIDVEAFTALTAPSPPQDDYPNYFITVSQDGSAVIGVCNGRPDGFVREDGTPDERPHVELADHIPAHRLNDRLEELFDKWDGARFAAYRSGPVAGMVKAGSLTVPVELIPNEEMAQACRHHETMTINRGYTHSKDPSVEASLTGAVAKSSGDQLWLWDWRNSVHLAPLAAETGALWMQEKYGSAAPSALVL